jgi:MarR family transcriptional regulator, organic hydroperoxide resistance regulator
MKNNALAGLNKNQIEEILYHALRTIYIFERVEIEVFGLTYQQMYLLKFLKRTSPLRVSETAALLRIPVFTATRLTTQLEKMKLLVRSRDMKDRRNIFIKLSREGEEMVHRIEEHTLDMILSRMSEYNAEQIQVMVEVIKNIDVILGVSEGMSGTAATL